MASPRKQLTFELLEKIANANGNLGYFNWLAVSVAYGFLFIMIFGGMTLGIMSGVGPLVGAVIGVILVLCAYRLFHAYVFLRISAILKEMPAREREKLIQVGQKWLKDSRHSLKVGNNYRSPQAVALIKKVYYKHSGNKLMVPDWMS